MFIVKYFKFLLIHQSAVYFYSKNIFKKYFFRQELITVGLAEPIRRELQMPTVYLLRLQRPLKSREEEEEEFSRLLS